MFGLEPVFVLQMEHQLTADPRHFCMAVAFSAIVR